jgi:protocatechuate 3,4-dioxygenase beta subunit
MAVLSAPAVVGLGDRAVNASGAPTRDGSSATYLIMDAETSLAGAAGRRREAKISVVNVAGGCAPLENVAVEIWQCDVAGNYSQYGTQTARTYLRGIQATNAAGEVTFTTLYPGWYQGSATHIHVEVARAGQSLKVTQIAFPEDVSAVVHTQGVYASRGINPTTNLRDGIFADSLASEMATVSGTPGSGYTGTFRIGVSA